MFRTLAASVVLALTGTLLTGTLASATDEVLDPTFNSTGIIHPTASTVKVAVQQSTGKYVVLTMTDWTDATITRYTESGAIDTTFGASGSVTMPGAGARQRPHVMVLGPNNTIFFGDSSGMVHKFTADGAPATGFGTAGIATLSTVKPSALLADADGGVTVAATDADFRTSALIRLDAAGSEQFNSPVTWNPWESARAVVVDPAGGYFVAGEGTGIKHSATAATALSPCQRLL